MIMIMIIIIMIKKKLAFCAKAGILQSLVSTSGRNQNNNKSLKLNSLTSKNP